jgi:hypothetical protein
MQQVGKTQFGAGQKGEENVAANAAEQETGQTLRM